MHAATAASLEGKLELNVPFGGSLLWKLGPLWTPRPQHVPRVMVPAAAERANVRPVLPAIRVRGTTQVSPTIRELTAARLW